MSEKETGGPAFPEVITNWNPNREEWEVTSQGGMTLRDYFAGKAVQGAISSAEGMVKPEVYALAAYKVADAMLKERAK